MERKELIQWLKGFLSFAKESEEFDGRKNAVWCCGEDGDKYKGKVIFSYYNWSIPAYENGVEKNFREKLKSFGWVCRWNDAGTVFIYPIEK